MSEYNSLDEPIESANTELFELDSTPHSYEEDEDLYDSQLMHSDLSVYLGKKIDPDISGSLICIGMQLAARLRSDIDIKEQIGQGGMGIVYLVKIGDEKYALKTCSAWDGEEYEGQGREMFRKEVEMQRRGAEILNAPQVKTFNTDDDADTPYMLMEYVKGNHLERYIRTSPIKKSLQKARDLALLVDKLHNAGIIHKDVKPKNVIIGADRTSLIDFGMAIERGEKKKIAGACFGTPIYLAPELVFTNDEDPYFAGDELCDQYSIGIILHEILTGTHPFKDSDSVTDIFYKKVMGTRLDPTKLREEVPKALIDITNRCLDTFAERRFPSCQDLAGELDLVLDQM